VNQPRCHGALPVFVRATQTCQLELFLRRKLGGEIFFGLAEHWSTVVTLGCVAQVDLRIRAGDSCCDIEPDIVERAHRASSPGQVGLDQGKPLDCLFVGLHLRPANGAVFKVAPDIFQVLPVGVAVWLICCGRLE
jgi:hypothetical protein